MSVSTEDLLQACLDACLRCLRDSERFLQACLLNPDLDQALYQDAIRACRDTLDICNLCASLLLRRDTIAPQVCSICAELCLRSSEQCQLLGGDVFARQSALSCRDCARLCLDMAQGRF